MPPEPLRWDSGKKYDEGWKWDQILDDPAKPKRRRRSGASLASTSTPQPDTAMNPFRYIIYLINSLFTSKPALRDPMPEGVYLDTLATRSGLTREQIEGFLNTQADLHIELARQGIPVDFVLRRFRMQPTSGGRYTSLDPDAVEVRDTLGFSLIVHPDETDKMRHECPVEKVGTAGKSGPKVDSVRGRPGNALKKYGVGNTGGTEVNGSNFRHRRADATNCTAALTDANGANPIALTVLDCTPNRLILGGAPTGTTGIRYLKITEADGNFTIYDQQLTNI